MVLYSVAVWPQSNFSLSGIYSEGFLHADYFASLESNRSNLLSLKDWGVAVITGREFQGEGVNQLYALSLAKKIDNHSLIVRYTPGYYREFNFVKDENYLTNDSTDAYLTTVLQYSELFGAGYGYKFSDKLYTGFTLRNFQRKTYDNTVGVVFTEDTLYLLSENVSETITRWQFDLGVTYLLLPELKVDFSSNNLYVISEESAQSSQSVYAFSETRSFTAGASWEYDNKFVLSVYGESTGSFLTSLHLNLYDDELTLSAGASYFMNQNGAKLSGIQPVIEARYGNAGLTLSGIWYAEKQSSMTLDDFEKNKISSLIQNGYSGNNISLSFFYLLHTRSEKTIHIVDVEILESIFPALTEMYIDKPFALAKIVNLSAKPVEIRPASMIPGFHAGLIYSSAAIIMPGDTTEIPVYTMMYEGYSEKKTVMANTVFSFFSSGSSDAEDQISRPVLLHGINAWDGKTANLKYFIKREIQEVSKRVKEIITDSLLVQPKSEYLRTFAYIEGIYNTVTKNLTYVADPLASADFVQYPTETLLRKGGDCDDLSVLFSSLYESVGMQTALIDYAPAEGMGHVTIMVNTGLNPEEAYLITANEQKYYIRKDVYGKDKVWLPLEVTDLRGFNEAWSQGAERFNREAIQEYGLVKGTITIIETQ